MQLKENIAEAQGDKGKGVPGATIALTKTGNTY
jgi:hypothetical protein